MPNIRLLYDKPIQCFVQLFCASGHGSRPQLVYIVFGFRVVNVFFLNLLIGEESGALMKQLGVIFNAIIALVTFVGCVATGGCERFFPCTLPRFHGANCLF